MSPLSSSHSCHYPSGPLSTHMLAFPPELNQSHLCESGLVVILWSLRAYSWEHKWTQWPSLLQNSSVFNSSSRRTRVPWDPWFPVDNPMWWAWLRHCHDFECYVVLRDSLRSPSSFPPLLSDAHIRFVSPSTVISWLSKYILVCCQIVVENICTPDIPHTHFLELFSFLDSYIETLLIIFHSACIKLRFKHSLLESILNNIFVLIGFKGRHPSKSLDHISQYPL